MIGRTQQFLLHLIGCMALLALPILFSPESLSLHAYFTNPPTQKDWIAYILVLGAFYGNFYFLIPKLYFHRKYFGFALLNLCCFAAITFLPALIIHSPERATVLPSPPPGNNPPPHPPGERPFTPPPGDNPPPFQPGPTQPFPGPSAAGGLPQAMPAQPPLFMDISQHLFLFLVAVFLALTLRIRHRWKRAEEEKLLAELAYLKAQINPHFLFNTLNNIYSLALEKSDRTPGAIVRLSSMMRYVLLDAGKGKVPLEQEINYLTDYIGLQQTRFESFLRVDFSVTGRPEGKKIVPLLLIPFVENAFKHGVNPEEPAPIRIRIDIGEQTLHLQVSNHKVTVQQPASDPGGLGIRNTQQRLGIFYSGRHDLLIEDGPATFDISLTLILT
jgi:hypothetical protein